MLDRAMTMGRDIRRLCCENYNPKIEIRKKLKT